MDKHDQLMTLRLKKPFTPFRIKLADGTSIELTEQLSFAVGQSSILVPRPTRGALQVSIADIASIEVMEPIA